MPADDASATADDLPTRNAFCPRWRLL